MLFIAAAFPSRAGATLHLAGSRARQVRCSSQAAIRAAKPSVVGLGRRGCERAACASPICVRRVGQVETVEAVGHRCCKQFRQLSDLIVSAVMFIVAATLLPGARWGQLINYSFRLVCCAASGQAGA
jgi:hypothetical protein